jgi:hypothetical protein
MTFLFLVLQMIATVAGVLVAFAIQKYWREFDLDVEKRKHRLQNLRTMASQSFQYTSFLTAEFTCTTREKENTKEDILPEIWCTQELEFPELKNELDGFLVVAEKHAKYFSDHWSSKAQGGNGILQERDYVVEVYGPGLAARRAFIKKCRRLIQEDEAWIANTFARRRARLRSQLMSWRQPQPTAQPPLSRPEGN